MVMITDLAAYKKWNTLNKATQDRILSNVFCGDCLVTTITKYQILPDKAGILLVGKCIQCGNKVARLVENDFFDV